MNNTNATVGSTKDMSKLVRPRFGPGMLLQHDDLELLNTYTRDLSRLLFGSLFGCGVICGLVVKGETKCDRVQVTVEPGVALSCSGDPVQVPATKSFFTDASYIPEIGSKLWVVLCGTTKCCGPRTSVCPSDDEETTSECTREKDGYEIQVLTERPKCVCACPEPAPEAPPPQNNPNNPNVALSSSNQGNQGTESCLCVDPTLECYQDHYAGKCGCACDDCGDCTCKCILLARLDRDGDTDNWISDHSVRRFVRPVLMRDPQVEIEKNATVVASTQALKVRREMERTAFEATEKTVLKATEQAAQQVAQQAAKDIGKKFGENVATRILEEIKKVAEQAVKDVAKKEAEPPQPRATTAPTAEAQAAEEQKAKTKPTKSPKTGPANT